MDITAVIPSLNPTEQLPTVVGELKAAGFDTVIVVDDGSDPDHQQPFEAVSRIDGVTVLRHEQNRGKGRALKTAFAFVTEHCPSCRGVVTVDGDGQHRADDVMAVARAVLERPQAVHLGVRDFDAPGVPWRSRTGNRITRAVMRLLCGVPLADTQTGLRGFSRERLPEVAAIPGERFEYETTMLLELCRNECPLEQRPIATVYLDDNQQSHFRPFADSVRIYSRLVGHFLRFAGSSLISFSLDIALFTILSHFVFSHLPESRQILFSTLVARLFSSALNFTLNRYVVFRSSRDLRGSLWRYYLLSAVQVLASAGLVMLICRLLPIPQPVVKCVVDTTLFFLSYRFQQQYVFRRTKA